MELRGLFEYINDPSKGTTDKLVDDIDRQVARFNTDDWRKRQMTIGELMDRNYEEGRKEGIEKGIEKGILQVAKAMKDKGDALEKISECTGISVDELEKRLEEDIN